MDPATKKVVSVDFDVAVDDALPEASDPNDPLPGTWVSGIAVDGTRLLVARNHVPHLEVVDRAGRVQGRLTIRASSAGASDVAVIGSRAYLAPSYLGGTASSVDMRTGRMTALKQSPARFDTARGRLVASGGGDGAVLSASGGGRLAGDAGLAGRPVSIAAVGPSGEIVTYSAADGTFSRSTAAGVTSVTVAPTTGKVTNPRGDVVTVTALPRVADLVVAGDGGVWYLEATTSRLVKVGF